MRFLSTLLFSLVVTFLLSSCVSFERLRGNYSEMVEASDLEGATRLIESKKWYKKDRNKVLYYLELGALARMQGDLEKSNEYLNKADFLIEDYKASVGAKGLAMVSNPKALPYRTEYYENIAVHYLKSLNYLQMNDLSAARVEARRTNIRLNELNDAVPDKPLKYHDDVLGHIVMGLSYEKNKEWNNAFIAYRNAADLFVTDGHLTNYMGVSIPEQLKCDVVRLAKVLGFTNEQSYYEKTLKPRCKNPEDAYGSLVVFWENGQGPVKDEQIVGFDVLNGVNDNNLRFVSYGTGLDYEIDPYEYNQYDSFSGINSIRVALPRYRSRPYPLRSASIEYAGGIKKMEKIEDLNEVATQSLRDRFHRELATALLRLAIKEATEASLRQIKTKKKDDDSDDEDDDDEEKDKSDDDEDEYSETAGIILSGAMDIVNTLTERADIRSWNSLPAEIHYTRIPLKRGNNTIKITFFNRLKERMETHQFTVKANGGLLVKNLITPEASVLLPQVADNNKKTN